MHMEKTKSGIPSRSAETSKPSTKMQSHTSDPKKIPLWAAGNYLPESISEMIQRQTESEVDAENVPVTIEDAVQTSSGQTLPNATRVQMERSLGADLSQVRVHSDQPASQAARDINAKAFTSGQHIYFGEGHYQPDSNQGKKLLIHELAHTLQQRTSVGFQTQQQVSRVGDPLEREADHVATVLMSQMEGALRAEEVTGYNTPPMREASSPAYPSHVQIQRRAETGFIQRDAASQRPETPEASQLPQIPDLPDLSTLTWNDDKNYLIYIRNGAQLFILPSTGLLYRPVVPRSRAPASRGPVSEPWFGVPVAGKEGRRLVRTSAGVGIWLDAGGRPAALLQTSLATLRTRMNVTGIDSVYVLHIHDDHVRDLVPEIIRSNIPARNIVIAGAWLQGTSGPFLRIINALRNTTDPRLLALGYGPSWAPAHPTVTPLPRAGLIRIPVHIGTLRMELLGTGESFEAYQQAHRAGQVRSEVADAASLPTIIQHPSANYQIFVMEDWRGENILSLRDAMERAEPGSFARMFAQVRIIEGFQHHMGVIRDDADVESLRVLLEATHGKTGELTVVVQTRSDSRNIEVMEALRKLGIRVVSVMKPTAGRPPGSAVASTSSSEISTKGTGVESGPGQVTAVRANQRLSTLRALLETVRTSGDLLTYPGSDRKTVEQELETQVKRLEGLTGERREIVLNALRTRRGQQSDLRTLEANATDLNRVEGIEAKLTDADLELVRYVAKNANDIRALDREIRRMQRTGQSSIELYELVARMRPEVARELMFDAQGRPLPRQQVMTSLRRQAELEQKAAGRPALVPSMGGKVIVWGLIGLDVAEQVLPIISNIKQTHLAENILRFLNIALWWHERGVFPRLGAAVDPVFGKAQTWTGADEKTQQSIWNRIERKVWEQRPENERPELSKEAKEAKGLDDLWIEEIPEASWNNFTLWITSHVRNFDEFAFYFLDTKNKAIRRIGNNFVTDEWEFLLGHFKTSGLNEIQNKWTKNELFSNTMKATAARVVKGTEEMISSTWKRRVTERPQPESPSISTPSETLPAQSPIKDLRPTRQAHFKAQARRELFSDFDPTYRMLEDKDWGNKDVTFMVFDFDPAPSGFVLVSGADYNTYAAIRSAKTFHYDPNQSVQIRKPRLERGEVLPRTARFGSKFPPDEDLSPKERKAVKDIGEDVRFREYPHSSSNVYMGEVQYWYVGPNIQAVGLVKKNAIE